VRHFCKRGGPVEVQGGVCAPADTIYEAGSSTPAEEDLVRHVPLRDE